MTNVYYKKKHAKQASIQKTMAVTHVSSHQHIYLSFSAAQVRLHPTEDLAAVKIPQETMTDYFFVTVDQTYIKTNEELLTTRSAIELVMLFGYPTGLWDFHNILPIVRTGYTASHSGLDFANSPEGRVNIANY